ncbi:hypothetical protein [Brevibacterium paucivorans]|uniref:N-acetyltransferase domain-containing protein n=1 Tax=Brevibacterium paucivorans TaxID=170994 RepID=A0A2N6VN86_9MICO|nr:hypothetical protein [Brevibacterium paucivorans]PMD05559.1 hypothetical protein CJ199_05980 [Brevibacterium paucivorans]
MITVEQVETRAQLREFCAVPAWMTPAEVASRVPLLRSDIVAWHRGKSWFPSPVTLLLARDAGGAVVGRCTVHSHADMDAKLGFPTLLFGALEFAHRDAFEALMSTVDEHAARTGKTHIMGPVSLLPNETGGVVVAGHEHPGFFDSAWNSPMVSHAFETSGFTPFSGGRTWEIDLGNVPAKRATAPTPQEFAEVGVELLSPGRLGVRKVLDRMLPTLNEAFDPLPYYTPISAEQFASQTSGLELLMDPGLIVAAQEVDASADSSSATPVAGFILTVPDPVEHLRATNGALSPTFAARLLRERLSRKRLTTSAKDAVLIIQGSRPSVQGRGVVSLLARQVLSTLIQKNYRTLRITFIGEDNPGSEAIPRKAGGHPLHDIRFFLRKVYT